MRKVDKFKIMNHLKYETKEMKRAINDESL